MADEFDEYEALEAEAEALSQPQAQQAAKAPAQTARPAMIPIEQRGKGRPPVPRPQPKAPVQEETQVPEKKQPRYIIQHQPEVLALVDTLTEEVTPIKVADYTIKDDGMYLLLAKLLNDQDTVITGAGYQ